jgi:superoxide reductase
MFVDYLKNYIKNSDSEGNEKHVPFISVKNCESCNELGVTIKVGKDIFHPSTIEHHIQYIELYGITKDEGKLTFINRFILSKENTIPYVKTHIKNNKFTKLIVLSECNIHGLWETEIII